MNDCMFSRRQGMKSLMAELELGYILVLNPGMGNIDLWVLGQEDLPAPAPFNRNSGFLIPPEGEILRLCQTTTHPTDRAQYVHVEDAGLEKLLTGGKIGVVHLQAMKKNVRDYLAHACPNVTLVDITGEFEALKARKSPREVEALRAAAAEYDRLFQAMGLILRPGRLEQEAVNEIRQRMAWQGADSETPAFHNMVELTSAPDGGSSAEEPMPWPGRRLRFGDRVNVTLRGYLRGGVSATLGRSYVLGEPSDEAKACWALAVEAQNLAASLSRPGMTLGKISEQVGAFLRGKGFPEDKTGWIHGIGTSVYEAPRNIDASREMLLEEGMVLSIGPGVQPEGKDPYRCVDAFVVTAQGAVRLSGTPAELRGL